MLPTDQAQRVQEAERVVRCLVSRGMPQPGKTLVQRHAGEEVSLHSAYPQLVAPTLLKGQGPVVVHDSVETGHEVIDRGGIDRPVLAHAQKTAVQVLAI